MRIHLFRLLALAAVLAFATALAACGGEDDDEPASGAPVEGEKGGTLKVMAAGDFEHIDPGESYYQFDYAMIYATQRPLYSYEPDRLDKAAPDLAASDPEISNGGRTVTVRLKPGIRFSPPVNREATSRDVKYAMERGFTAAVPNGYAPTYFSVLEGAPEPGAKEVPDIAGIETPDDRTIVFKLKEPNGSFVQALSLPLTAPVPEEYARKFDESAPSRYGSNQVATGPYMLQADRSGKVTGYEVGKRAVLVRNPNWDAATDRRPAYLDRIEFVMGNEDTLVASRRILNGKGMVNGDFVPDPPVLKRALDRQRDQITFTPLGNRYITLNTTVPPLDNLNVRKAIVAATDRNALRLTRGGPAIGDIATHFLTPGQPGFEEAGGMEGPGYDFLRNPDGDMELAAEYMRKAGYETGSYEGKPLLMVGDDSGVGARTAEVFQAQLAKLGFETTFRQVPHETMYSKFCNVPEAKVAICPNIGWLPDFPDGAAMLNPTFNGEAIVPENNSNQSMLDVPAINAAMEKADRLQDPEARAKAWGEIDRMVTAQAPAVPWLWDKQDNIMSDDVQGVIARWNALWDVSYTSLK